MSYTALYRKYRPSEFENVKGHIEKSDQGRPHRTCLSVLRHPWNRKNYGGKDFCESCKL